MVIVNADVRTMAGERFEHGYIHMDGGKIVSVGPMERAPRDAERFDAAGAVALPGLVDAHCHIGMWEDGLGFEGDDGNEDTDPVTPQLRGLDGVNPLDRAFTEALDWGVTTVVTGPGSANPIAGQMCAMKTCGRRVDDMLLAAPLAVKMAMGENPKTSYHEKQQGPATRMGIAAAIREQLAKAKKYGEQLERAAADDDFDEPEYDAKCEALLPLLRGEIKAHIHAHRADDIFTAIRLAKEFHLDYVLVHCTEGHLIAQELAEEGACAITGPLMTTRSKPELANATDRNPAVLSQHGVKTAICTDYNVMPIGLLPICAGMAVREGMDYQQALAAITIYPAQIVGIDHRVGSLKVGKDADFAVFSQDPLTIAARPQLVVIGGKIVRR